MFFLLQKEDKYNGYDIDVLLFKKILDREKYLHEYMPLSLSDFYDDGRLLDKESFPKHFRDAIPIGTIDFVSAWLNIFTDVKQENPIEVPPCLRTDEFLKRKYSIVTKDNIPTSGEYFIKDASQLKVFSYNGMLQHFLHEDIWKEQTSEFNNELHLNPNHLYQISEVVNILSEYRVYIIGGEIQTITNYNGDPCVLPDIELIKKANNIYSLQPDYPKSYTIDIAVTDRGTAIIECHILLSTGLYNTIWGSNLAWGYRDSLNYLLSHNTPPKEFSNFTTFTYKKD